MTRFGAILQTLFRFRCIVSFGDHRIGDILEMKEDEAMRYLKQGYVIPIFIQKREVEMREPEEVR